MESEIMMQDRLQKTLDAFERYNGVYQRAAMEEAVALKEEIVPRLLERLQSLLSDPARYESDGYYTHIYALVLLGHFREARAHDVIMDIASLPGNIASDLFGDMITEDFHRIMYATCGGSLERIKGLVLDRNAYEYCRGAAMEAIVHAVADGSVGRDAALEFFSGLFTGEEARRGSHFWDAAASCICDIYPMELMPVIERGYKDGLIWPGYIDYDSFEMTLAAGKEKALEAARNALRRELDRDVHDHLSHWACFRRNEEQRFAGQASGGQKPAARNKQKKKKKEMAKASKKKNRR